MYRLSYDSSMVLFVKNINLFQFNALIEIHFFTLFEYFFFCCKTENPIDIFNFCLVNYKMLNKTKSTHFEGKKKLFYDD